MGVWAIGQMGVCPLGHVGGFAFAIRSRYTLCMLSNDHNKPGRKRRGRERTSAAGERRSGARRAFCVYVLIDPRSDDIVYVGHTGNLAERRAQHLAGTDQLSGLLVQQMKLNGFVPLVAVLERCRTLTQALSSEIFWIEMFRARGAKLLNGQVVGGAVARKRRRGALEASLSRMAALKDIANGRPAHGFSPWTPRDEARLAGMRKAGMSIEAMADALERPVTDIAAQVAKPRASRKAGRKDRGR